MMATQKLIGVNLGGWLVLERWLTPSLFDGMLAEDEYSWCLEVGADKDQRLKHHRDTFITEKDFVRLSEAGVNAVRIPVGYWLFGDAEPYVGCVEYLDKAVEWGKKHKLHILIDLHGAPGSQNGWDHSGKRGEVEWHLHADYIRQTVDMLGRLAKRYPDVWGIEVLNEPHWDIPKEVLAGFYEAAYAAIREHSEAAVVMHDAFRPHLWGDVLAGYEYSNVIIDSHLYQCFSDEDKALGFAGHIAKAKGEWRDLIAGAQQTHAMIVGEWSVALPHPEPEDRKQAYAAAQREVFAESAGHFYWTYKKEQADDWDWSHSR